MWLACLHVPVETFDCYLIAFVIGEELRLAIGIASGCLPQQKE
jgi:hypothetical protein